MRRRSSLPRLVIFGDPEKGPVAEAMRQFALFLKGKAEIVASCHIQECRPDVLRRSDFAVVLGGDGSIISAARYLSEARVPVIGVNLGRLGFLAEFSVAEFKDLFDDIISGQARIERRMMLCCQVRSGPRATGAPRRAERARARFCSTAVNDVFILAGPPFRVIEMNIAVDGERLPSCVGDGLILSTPTGSTAYNLSAGGPILSGSMEAMVITPICPHSLNFRPIVIDAASVVEISCTRINEGTTVAVDGQVLTGLALGEVVTVSRIRNRFLVVENPMRTRWDTLVTKLGWARKPRYASE
ncbi:MAG: NAD(+)/NADH kinase [Planctomycetes bacterium]|jgi:NAD+ kinase|nr:NAD(+)/NADH kinase [Planctomycetota bacterium]